MKLYIETINKKYRDLKLVENLYEESFPDDEKAPFESLIERLKKNSTFLGFRNEDDEFVGFAYLIHETDLHYIFYFAIMPHLQNKGYGSSILQYIKELYKDESIFFEIEVINENADNINERKRRKNFYLKNGFKESGYGYHFYVDYEVMIRGNKIEPDRWHDMFIDFSDGFVDVEFKRLEK